MRLSSSNGLQIAALTPPVMKIRFDDDLLRRHLAQLQLNNSTANYEKIFHCEGEILSSRLGFRSRIPVSLRVSMTTRHYVQL